jgi:hypothetical protein
MLHVWANFFTLTGSAAATFIGLLFVVVTLNTNMSASRTMEVARASMAPAVYGFAEVLFQSMVVLVPWQQNWPSGAIFAVLGIGSFTYRINAVRLRRIIRLKAIDGPVDRIFHNAVPIFASVSLISGGAGLIAGAPFAPFAIAASSTLLLISGIYRTWDETLVLIGLRDRS